MSESAGNRAGPANFSDPGGGKAGNQAGDAGHQHRPGDSAATRPADPTRSTSQSAENPRIDLGLAGQPDGHRCGQKNGYPDSEKGTGDHGGRGTRHAGHGELNPIHPPGSQRREPIGVKSGLAGHGLRHQSEGEECRQHTEQQQGQSFEVGGMLRALAAADRSSDPGCT